MPTLQDETLPQRYTREHQDYLKLCESMTAEQVADLQLQLHNALAAAPTLPQPMYDEAKERELFNSWYGELPTTKLKETMWMAWEACAQSRAKSVEVGHE